MNLSANLEKEALWQVKYYLLYFLRLTIRPIVLNFKVLLLKSY